MRTQEALQSVAAWVNSRAEKIYFIAVSGGTCAGKSTFANALKEFFGKSDVSIIRLDDYFKDFSDPTLPHGFLGYPQFDVPDAYHLDEIGKDLARLDAGQTVVCPVYDIASNRRISAKGAKIYPRRILVVEGLFTFQIASLYSPLKIYVEASDTIRLLRRIDRDTSQFGIPEGEVNQAFFERFLPLHQQFVQPQRGIADIIVETD